MSFTAHDFDASVPDLGNDPLPVDPYVSAEYFTAERENIFGKVWLNVARSRNPRTRRFRR